MGDLHENGVYQSRTIFPSRLTMPSVSVIIPTYNRAWALKDAVESVLNQTYGDIEIIVVDDGSTDRTRECMEGFTDPRVRCLYKENGGAASALNLGIRQSTGTYIARLDSDDVFLPKKLEIQVRVMNENPNVGLVYTQAYDIDREGNILGLYLTNHTCPCDPLKVLRHFLFPPSQSIMFRKDCIDTVGYFDENMPITEDWDFCIRMARRYPFAYCDEPLVKIRRHPGMITGDKLASAQAILRVMQKHVTTLSSGEGDSWMSPHYYRLGRLYFYGREYDKARHAFSTALRHDPLSLKNLAFRGISSLPPGLIERLKGLKRSLCGG
ncbi:MAG: glycosyltransferase [bacterium]